MSGTYRLGTRVCGECGSPMFDVTMEFDNGLILRSVRSGVEVGIRFSDEDRTRWLNGVLTRDELRAFIEGRYDRPSERP
jgi:hypothetical protein